MTRIREHFLNWKASPKKWEIGYVVSRLKALSAARSRHAQLVETRRALLEPSIESEYVDLLFDPEFRRSVAQVRDYTCLDVVRLANLWMLVKMVGCGTYLEIGSFRGGTALHICNAIEHPHAPFYCFDPFEKGGFENLTECDDAFRFVDFTETQHEAVSKLLSSRPNAHAIQGFFPSAAEGMDLHDVVFCHLDVDVYEATRNSLEYLLPRLAPRSLIVLDDMGHSETPGVRKAMDEFLAAHPSFLAIPMFPCQAVLLPKSFWQS